MMRKLHFFATKKENIAGLNLNHAVFREDKEMIDIITGTPFVCDRSRENFRCLNGEQLKRFSEKFRRSEQFVKINRDIHAMPFMPVQTVNKGS